MNQTAKFSIGADPEIFVKSKATGRFEAAFGLIPGDKAEPYKVNKGAVQVDGMALEFNIDPSSTFEEFKGNLKTVFSTIQAMVPGHEVMRAVTVKLEKDYKATLPQEAFVMGCDPDVDAYTGAMNDRPDGDYEFRSVGGHVHIGGIFPENATTMQEYAIGLRMARLMDKYLGVYSVLWDTDTTRKLIYGKAGACRIKEYGVEYRTLSNAWLFNDALIQFVYNQTKVAFEALHAGEDVQTNFYKTVINNSLTDLEFFTTDHTARKLKELLGASVSNPSTL